MARRNFDPPGMRYDAVSQAVAVGEMLILSGQVSIDASGVVGVGDAAAQVAQCFANIGLVLGEAGGSLDDIAKLTCYATAPSHLPAYFEARTRLFADRRPASTTIIVGALAYPEFLIEIEAIAYRAGGWQSG